MEDTLKRLLDAELRAQAIVDQASKERDRLVAAAQDEVEAAEERFAARIPEIQTSFVSKAEERAAQTVAELRRRYEERQMALKETAELHRDEALDAAVAIILDPDQN